MLTTAMKNDQSKQVDTNLLGAAIGSVDMDELVESLQKLRMPATTTASSPPCRVPIFNGENGIELSIGPLRDVAEENC